MDIKEIQKKAVEIIETRLSKKEVEPNVDLTMTHLIEEIGELASQINNKKMKRKEFDLHNIGEEIADCILLLTYLAKQHNLNIEDSLKDKIKSLGERFLK